MNLSLLPIQLFLFFLLLWPVSRVWFRFRDRALSTGSFLFWTGVWLLGAVAIFFPEFLTYLAHFFSIGRGSDLAVYGAVMVLFYLVFRLSVVIENLRNEISILTRELALKQEENERLKKHS